MKPRHHPSWPSNSYLWLLGFALSVGACEASPITERPPVEEGVNVPELLVQEPTAIEQPSIPAPGNPYDEVDEVGEVADRAEALVRRAMEQAAAEAAGAGEAGCEQAFQEATRMLTRMREQGVVGEGIGPPRREAFLRACARLPEDAQRCIAPSYSMTHADECRRAREALAPELQREVRELMNEAF